MLFKYLEIHIREAFGVVFNIFGACLVINIQPKQSIGTRITEGLLHFRQAIAGQPSNPRCSK